MTLYIKTPKGSTQKLLELINEFNKVAGYKASIQNSAAFIYTNDETSEKESFKKSFKIMSKNEIPMGLHWWSSG